MTQTEAELLHNITPYLAHTDIIEEVYTMGLINDTSILELGLPFPPSVNHYWGQRTFKGRTIRFIGARGKQFRKDVEKAIEPHQSHCKKFFYDKPSLGIKIQVFAGDRRKRDLDNLNKALLDALEHAGAYEDDCYIDYIMMSRDRTKVSKDNAHIVITLFKFNEVKDD